MASVQCVRRYSRSFHNLARVVFEDRLYPFKYNQSDKNKLYKFYQLRFVHAIVWDRKYFFQEMKYDNTKN